MPRNPLNRQIASTEHWRCKAIGRGKELKTQKQLVKECRVSRDRYRKQLETTNFEIACAQERIRELEEALKKN